MGWKVLLPAEQSRRAWYSPGAETTMQLPRPDLCQSSRSATGRGEPQLSPPELCRPCPLVEKHQHPAGEAPRATCQGLSTTGTPWEAEAVVQKQGQRYLGWTALALGSAFPCPSFYRGSQELQWCSTAHRWGPPQLHPLGPEGFCWTVEEWNICPYLYWGSMI